MGGFWDFVDKIGSGLDSFGQSIKPFAPVLDFGLGMYQMNQVQSMADKQREAQVQMERERYDNALQMMNAANALGGGGGGANRAAQMANERARLAALKKAIKYQKKMGSKARKELEPWKKTGEELLPAVSQTYRGGLEGLNAMAAFLATPEEMAKLSAAPASGEARVELPEFMRGAKKKDGK